VTLLLISVIFCEAVAIYGVIMAIILQGKINDSQCLDATYASCAFSGYALFWTGVSVGFSNLFCGYMLIDLESVWAYLAAVAPSPTLKTLTLSSRF
jgi:V-type H+-transporting ATPase 21kDa proteolipid subunit